MSPFSAQLATAHLWLVPLPPGVAAGLPADRDRAARELRAELSPDWPQPDLLDVLPRQARFGPEEAGWGIWAIVVRDERLVVGDAGFFGPPADDGSIEIGYGIVPSHRRRGYATEAATALIEWALRQPGVQSIVAGCDADNEGSIGTLGRVGFRQTDRRQDKLWWRLRPADRGR